MLINIGNNGCKFYMLEIKKFPFISILEVMTMGKKYFGHESRLRDRA